jgi:hypothetical protein
MSVSVLGWQCLFDEYEIKPGTGECVEPCGSNELPVSKHEKPGIYGAVRNQRECQV